MINTTSFADRIPQSFEPTSRGVVGLVDDLLALCQLHPFRIHFHDGHCSIVRLGADIGEVLEISVPKSVFRAALARIAAICHEQHPDSVSPYGGEAEIAVVTPQKTESQIVVPLSTCHVSFVNTPSDQRLEMRFASSTVERSGTSTFHDAAI